MSAANNKVQTHVKPQLAKLDRLVGEWDIAVTFRHDPANVLHGSATCEWLGGGYLVQRSEVAGEGFPQGLALIGGEDATDTFPMHYFDSRGISRLYTVSIDNNVWNIWRDDPEFSQRFKGIFSDDGNTITAYWENSRDGSTWEHDFDLVYTRIK